MMPTRKTEIAGMVVALLGIAIGAIVAGAVQGRTDPAGGIRFLSSRDGAALELPLAAQPDGHELQLAELAAPAFGGGTG
jgi:hypothetical protein